MTEPTTQANQVTQTPTHIEMSCLIAVNNILQTTEAGMGRIKRQVSPEQRLEKALNLLMEKEAQLQAAGHEPSTEFLLFSKQLSKAYNLVNSGDTEVAADFAAKAANGVKIRCDALPDNPNRLAPKDPEIAEGDEKKSLTDEGARRAAIFKEISTAEKHTDLEKCAAAVCSKEMAKTALTSSVDPTKLNSFVSDNVSRQQ